jgi:HAD domain in Swiss Army Knife RNA repair proteins
MRQKPLLLVDIDGVISLFGSPPPWASGHNAGADSIAGSLHTIDGVPHFLSHLAAAHLLELADDFDLVWASGWEERADEHLPHLLGLPAGLPHLCFTRGVRGVRSGNAHWKLDAIERHAGARPLAWVDDSLSDECHAWARNRGAEGAPTLLVQTAPERGLTAAEARALAAWARGLAGDRSEVAQPDEPARARTSSSLR